MAKLIKPILFSDFFKVDPIELSKSNLFDPILNCDTILFIDPLLISGSRNPIIKVEAADSLRGGYEKVVRLLAQSVQRDDAAWRTARKILNLNERSETALGYGGASTSGSSRPISLRNNILQTIKEIIQIGENDPEIIFLIGILEDGVGPDTISDLTTNFIFDSLCKITQEFCRTQDVPLYYFDNPYNTKLPKNPYSEKPIVLVPQDILRDLPLAADWEDVSRVVAEIEQIRNEVNVLLSRYTKATIRDKKEALRKVALSSAQNIKAILEAVKSSSDYYDPNEDIFNFYALRAALSRTQDSLVGLIAKPSNLSNSELNRIVLQIIQYFKQLVENGNLWELLWHDGKPKRERACQLLFYGVSEAFCKANDIDISPETNLGGGPVDFKFSKGHSARVLVEMKLSKGSVVHGYEKQLEIYKKASSTDAGIFVILNVGGIGGKLSKIKKIKADRERSGEIASEIIVVDAQQKRSASKA